MKRIILLFLVMFQIHLVKAQWQPTNGPYGGRTNCITYLGTNLFAGTNNNGVFLSTDNGLNWTQVNNGLTSKTVFALAVNGSTIYAGTTNGVYTSTNNGSNWIHKGTFPTYITCFLFVDSTIFVGTQYDRLYRTTLNDTIWTPITLGNTGIWVTCLTKTNTCLFAGTYSDGIYRSCDHGGTWSAINNGISQQKIQSIFYDGTKIYAGATCHDLFLSSDSGSTWVDANNGITSNVLSFAKDDSNLYAATWNGGVCRMPVNGSSWSAINTGLTTQWTNAITTFNGNIFVSTFGEGIYFSNNFGKSWTQHNNGLVGTYIKSMVKIREKIVATSDNYNLYISDNTVNSWPTNDIITHSINLGNLSAIAASDSTLYLACDTLLLLSSDTGNTWSAISQIPTATSLTLNDTDIIMGTTGKGVYLSHDNGAQWIPLNPELLSFNYVYASALIGHTIFDAANQDYGLYSSDDYGVSWHYSILGGDIMAMQTYHNKVFAGTLNYGIYFTTDTGQIWHNAIGNVSIFSLTADDSILLASTGQGDVLISIDDGNTWNMVDNGSIKLPISFIKIFGSEVYAGTYGRGIWKSSLSELINNTIITKLNSNSNSDFSLFPNPANDHITIETPIKTRIEIINMEGQIITSFDNVYYEKTIDIRRLSSGVYIIKAITEKGSSVKKFIKE